MQTAKRSLSSKSSKKSDLHAGATADLPPTDVAGLVMSTSDNDGATILGGRGHLDTN
jgi:hypothetical protein